MAWDLSAVVASLTEGATITVKRTTPGGYVKGVFVPGVTSTFTAGGLALPLEGAELDRLPEGMRTRELRQAFVTTALRTSPPDLIVVDGADWEVQRVEAWPAVFWRVIAAKVGA